MPGGAVHPSVPVVGDGQRRSKTRSFGRLLRDPASVLGLSALDGAILPRTLGLPHDHHPGAELERRIQLLLRGHFRAAAAQSRSRKAADQSRNYIHTSFTIVHPSTHRRFDLFFFLETRTAAI